MHWVLQHEMEDEDLIDAFLEQVGPCSPPLISDLTMFLCSKVGRGVHAEGIRRLIVVFVHYALYPISFSDIKSSGLCLVHHFNRRCCLRQPSLVGSDHEVQLRGFTSTCIKGRCKPERPSTKSCFKIFPKPFWPFFCSSTRGCMPSSIGPRDARGFKITARGRQLQVMGRRGERR